tara:strand:+ start:1187 stop:1735 length:549 start_codon:yes stop_codon:yes gene_type:complete
MDFIEQNISGVFLIKPSSFQDERGEFRRHFCRTEFSEHSIISDVSQSNLSHNIMASTLRGFHYQINEYSEGKTFSCLNGEIYDIVVDLRLGSKTFMKWISYELSEKNKYSLHVPPGCANAFLTLKDNTLIHYYCSAPYTPEMERGIRYNDPAFSFKWPLEPIYISEKDKLHADFDKTDLMSN